MRCKREKILLPPNSRKNVDFDLSIEQPITGIKCKNNAYRKVNGASAKHPRCNTPAHAYPPLKTHKPTPENLFNVDIKETPVRPPQSAGNISTSRTTASVAILRGRPWPPSFLLNFTLKFAWLTHTADNFRPAIFYTYVGPPTFFLGPAVAPPLFSF